MLGSALQSLMKLSVPNGGRVSIVVVENDRSERSAGVVDSFRTTSPFPITYVVEPTIGIPFARNRALAEAIALGADWIAMMDDDERVPSDWLVTLHDACLKYDAEVATGPIVQIPEGTPPPWWKPVADSRNVTGEFRRDAYTNNVLFRSRLVSADGLSLTFDQRFLHGAEDIDFFRRAYNKGVRIVSVAEAKVIEDVPAGRLDMKRHLQRNYMIAASNSFFRVVHDGRAKATRNRLPSIIRRFLVGLLLVAAGSVLKPFARKPGEKTSAKGASSLAKAIGSFSGLSGKTSNYYDKVDGT
ncbi:MAG: glycosyltransferase family 2 protein [Proteobacteria bacterium]|nr:glycosyltransferase family 2 protein [Pseudomonadota bacterium]